MLKNKAARLAAVLTVFVTTVVASSRGALAMNDPGLGSGAGSAPQPRPLTGPIAAVADSGPNWALIVSAGITLVVIAGLFLLLRGARPRALRHA